MSEICALCGGPVNPYDVGTYKQVSGWVHGKKRDSMTLREDTGKFAHEYCVNKAKSGQAPDQPDLFGEDFIDYSKESENDPSPAEIEELLDKSSLGTPEAKALIATVSDEDAAKVVQRSREMGELIEPTEPGQHRVFKHADGRTCIQDNDGIWYTPYDAGGEGPDCDRPHVEEYF